MEVTQSTSPTRVPCALCGNDSKPNSGPGGLAFCCEGCKWVYEEREGVCALPSGPSGPGNLNQRFEFLKQPDLLRPFRNEGDVYFFQVAGLHCGSCVWVLERLAARIHEIKGIEIDFARSRVRVECTDPKGLFDFAVAAGGASFDLQILRQGEQLTRREGQDALGLFRIAVAAFSSANIMIFAIANYAGAEGLFSRIFDWGSLLLFLPVLLFSAIPIFKNAWGALRLRTVSIDVPLAIAILSGFVLSSLSVITEGSDIFFDSLSMFVFLVLSTRFAVEKIQERLRMNEERNWIPGIETARRLNPRGVWEIINPSEILPSNELKVECGEMIPTDGRVLEGVGAVDESALTGESQPVFKTTGALVFAGTRLVQGELSFASDTGVGDSRVGRLLAASASIQSDPFEGSLHRFARFFTWGVLGLAALALWSQGFSTMLTLLIIACPCAMAFGSPVATALALQRLRRKGIWVRRPEILERLLRVKRVLFDKTGTLTTGEMEILEGLHVLPESAQIAILSLECQSLHPIGRALTTELLALGLAPLAVENRKEIPGVGVEGRVAGANYRLRAAPDSSTQYSGVLVERDGETLGIVLFRSQVRPEARTVLDEIRRKGLSLRVLSGDSQEAVQEILSRLGLSLVEGLGRQSPEGKISGVREHSLMVGDGINDAGALAKADVGVALGARVFSTGDEVPVVMTQVDLRGLLELFSVARRLRWTRKTLILLAAVYNILVIPMALMGHVGPLVAAILMPLNTLTILFLVVWGMGRGEWKSYFS